MILDLSEVPMEWFFNQHGPKIWNPSGCPERLDRGRLISRLHRKLSLREALDVSCFGVRMVYLVGF